MKKHGPWNTDDFDLMSWHDAHVHGFKLVDFDDDEGTADLLLDIDYILNWEKTDNEFSFTVCSAELRFHKVFGMKFELDYATPTAGMCPFSIDGIERKPLKFPTGYRSYNWRIPINWPHGSIEFEAPDFTQTMVGKPYVQGEQVLSSKKRE
jgi:hypothetical protein